MVRVESWVEVTRREGFLRIGSRALVRISLRSAERCSWSDCVFSEVKSSLSVTTPLESRTAKSRKQSVTSTWQHEARASSTCL
jgi:hypothetical protein